MADRGLGEAERSRCSRHALVLEERVERYEQVQVEFDAIDDGHWGSLRGRSLRLPLMTSTALVNCIGQWPGRLPSQRRKITERSANRSGESRRILLFPLPRTLS